MAAARGGIDATARGGLNSPRTYRKESINEHFPYGPAGESKDKKDGQKNETKAKEAPKRVAAKAGVSKKTAQLPKTQGKPKEGSKVLDEETPKRIASMSDRIKKMLGSAKPGTQRHFVTLITKFNEHQDAEHNHYLKRGSGGAHRIKLQALHDRVMKAINKEFFRHYGKNIEDKDRDLAYYDTKNPERCWLEWDKSNFRKEPKNDDSGSDKKVASSVSGKSKTSDKVDSEKKSEKKEEKDDKKAPEKKEEPEKKPKKEKEVDESSEKKPSSPKKKEKPENEDGKDYIGKNQFGKGKVKTKKQDPKEVAAATKKLAGASKDDKPKKKVEEAAPGDGKQEEKTRESNKTFSGKKKVTEALESTSDGGRPPKAWYFRSTGEAYDTSQSDDRIKDGDVLVVKNEGVVGILFQAWPTACTTEHGNFHFWSADKIGNNPPIVGWERWVETKHEGEMDYTASVELAKQEMKKLGLAPVMEAAWTKTTPKGAKSSSNKGGKPWEKQAPPKKMKSAVNEAMDFLIKESGSTSKYRTKKKDA